MAGIQTGGIELDDERDLYALHAALERLISAPRPSTFALEISRIRPYGATKWGDKTAKPNQK